MQPITARIAAEPLESIDSDDALALAAASDPAAFEALYVRYRTRVFRYARSRCDDDDEATELTSIAFARAFAAIGRYRTGRTGFRAWLFRIARNAAFDRSRRRATAARHAGRLGGATDVQGSPEDDLIRAESIERVRSLVARLPESQREVVLLRYAAGLSAREIAAVVGRSEAAVHKHQQRALAALREAFHATES